jgi:hypothetical protein
VGASLPEVCLITPPLLRVTKRPRLHTTLLDQVTERRLLEYTVAAPPFTVRLWGGCMAGTDMLQVVKLAPEAGSLSVREKLGGMAPPDHRELNLVREVPKKAAKL